MSARLDAHAHRVLFMVEAGRESPDLPCDAIFEEDEWETIHMASARKKAPKDFSRLMDIRHHSLAAEFCGFKVRECDGFIGEKRW
jgi:hypothetical protein